MHVFNRLRWEQLGRYSWYFLLFCNVGYSKFVWNYLSFSHWWEIRHLIFKNNFFYPIVRQPVIYNWEAIRVSQAFYRCPIVVQSSEATQLTRTKYLVHLTRVWIQETFGSSMSSILKNNGTYLNSQKKVCLASHNSVSNFLSSNDGWAFWEFERANSRS